MSLSRFDGSLVEGLELDVRVPLRYVENTKPVVNDGDDLSLTSNHNAPMTDSRAS